MIEEKHISRVKRLYSQLIAQLDADFVEECVEAGMFHHVVV